MKKIFFLVVIFLAGRNFLSAQPDDDEGQLHLGARIAFTQVKSNCGSLALNYTDQSPSQHRLTKDFSVAGVKNLYGLEFTMSYTSRKKIYIEPMAIAMYFNKNVDMFSFGSGLGYEIVPLKSRKLVFLPFCILAYNRFDYFIEKYSLPDIYRVNVNGKILKGNPSIYLMHNSFVAVPQLAVKWYWSNMLAVHVTGGYRFDLASSERTLFVEGTEAGTYNSKYARTANVNTSWTIQENGKYIDRKCFDLSGILFSAGVIMSF